MPNLPAPYVSPWRELGRNLRAALADLRLRLLELWRRNREGDLPRPGAWPQDLAPLFWPLLLLLAFVLVAAAVALVVQGSSLLRQQPPPAPAQVADPQALVDPLQTQATDPQLLVDSIPGEGFPPIPAPADRQSVAPDPPPVDLPSPETEALAPELVQPDVPPDADGASMAEHEVQISAESLADPLFQAVQTAAGSADLVLQANAIVDRNSMVLVISSEGWSLPTTLERNQLAMRWQQVVDDFGYGELILVDQDDRPLGRSARVGEGMILFESEVKP